MSAVTCPGCGPVAHVALSCCDDLDRERCDMTPFGG